MALPPDKMDDVRRQLEEKDSLRLRLITLADRALQFKEKIWDDDDKFWDEAEKHPIRFKARYADMNTILSKPWADRIIAEQGMLPEPRKKVTAEDLEALDLTPEQVERLATVNDEGGE